MCTDGTPDHDYRLQRLRAEWAGYVLAGLSFITVAYLVLRQDWGANYALRWLLVALGLVIYQFVFLWRHLGENRRADSAQLLPTLGLANWITMTRGVFNASLAGFLLGPWPEGWLAWAPGGLYLASAVMDYVDGYAARVTGQVTVLGEALDMHWDGVGMFLAVSLSVLYGQAPVPYLLVGLARYLYLFGIWQRKKRGLPVYDLLPSRIRRPFAGVQMGVVAVVLLPVYGPPATQIAVTLFMIPFLLNFLRDWLTVSGQIRPSRVRASVLLSLWQRRLEEFFPLVARAALVVLLIDLLLHQLRLAAPGPGMILVALPALVALLLGAAGRLFSLAVLLMAGFGLQAAPLEWRYWAILLLGISLMMTGTGRFSLWKPEDWLIYKRAGERTSAAHQ